MELKEELELFKDRIISEEIRSSDIDIINDCIDLIESLEEFEPQEALDESAEALMPTNGISIIDSDLNIYISEENKIAEVLKEKSKKKEK